MVPASNASNMNTQNLMVDNNAELDAEQDIALVEIISCQVDCAENAQITMQSL